MVSRRTRMGSTLVGEISVACTGENRSAGMGRYLFLRKECLTYPRTFGLMILLEA